MECQFCKANEATIHFKQVLNGVVKELVMCRDCAVQRGLNPAAPLGLTDLLFSIGGKPDARTAVPAEDPSCPVCHMHFSDFKNTSRLGCPSCYDAFVSELGVVIASMQRGRRHHRGRVPAGVDMGGERARLQKVLRQAVADQNFEEAARVRDLLREIEGVPGAVQKKETAS